MAIRKNQALDTNTLVEQNIGTAYDKVAKVADALDDVAFLADELEQFNNRWQGLLPAAPTTRKDGSPLQDGDSYSSSNGGVTYFYLNGQWVQQGATEVLTEVHLVTAGDIVGNTTKITLNNPYGLNRNAIHVYVSGVYNTSKSVDPVNGNYSETDQFTITFDGKLVIGEKVTVVIGKPIDTINSSVRVIQGLVHIDNPTQEIVVPDSLTYLPGQSNLGLYRNGLLLYPGVDYFEVSPTVVRIVDPVQIGDQFVFRIGEIFTDTDKIQSNIITIPTLTDFIQVSQETNSVVIVKGAITPTDNMGGTYVYDDLMPTNKANGVTIIDTKVLPYLQGTGLGNGCWIRQYDDFLMSEWFGSPYKGMRAFQEMKAVHGDRYNMPYFHEPSFYDKAVGGGVFIYDANMPATEHNGYTIISANKKDSPEGNLWFDAPNATENPGCWVRESTTNLSVYNFGCTPSNALNSLIFSKIINSSLPVEVPTNTPLNLSSAIDASSSKLYSYGTINVSGSGSITNYTNLLA